MEITYSHSDCNLGPAYTHVHFSEFDYCVVSLIFDAVGDTVNEIETLRIEETMLTMLAPTQNHGYLFLVAQSAIQKKNGRQLLAKRSECSHQQSVINWI